ncbi:hypothetical protein [Marasmitruncus massiliensis]|uniref:hypothetical protein n=1 Tax=Marasmitruncus massiliensis TaxID=1944642 RepID=UPI0015E0ECE6|nr:hypothetical protein [Marasmitruncus massiliensis]
MKRTIALCGTDESTAHELACCGRYLVLNFIEEPERRGDVKLAYFLRDGPLVSLAVVGYPGAEGLSACDYLRSQSGTLPILWLCDRMEFEPEAKRLDVCFCGTGPPGAERLAVYFIFTGINGLAVTSADRQNRKTIRRTMP